MHEESEMIMVAELEEVNECAWDADDPRPALVTVVIKSDQGQGDFYLESDPEDGGVPIVQDFVMRFDNNQNGVESSGFLVSFNLPANKGVNAAWTFDDDPIWVKLVDHHGACPGNKADNDPNILTDPTLSADKRTLTVTNANATEQYFGFALRFVTAGGKGKKLTYDPIGDNKNGTSLS